jgi:hypothetical protein
LSRIRLAATAVMLSCGLMLLGHAGIAKAQDAPRLTQVVPMSGTVAKGGKAFKGKQFTGTYTIDKFVSSGGKLYSVGTLKGKAGSKKINKEGVRLPATAANSAAAGAAQAHSSQVPPLPLPPLPAGNACSILSLNLGPINLNVLGLVVRTNEIQLRIDAVQGPGNLLGNLLCGLTGLLNPATGGTGVANTPLAQLAQILNALLALSPRTA